MEDTEKSLQPSKKRAAGRQLSRDNPGLDDEEETSEQETGTFKKASDEVLASRRILKVRRHQTSSAPSSNPFAGIRLVPSTVSSAPPSEVVTEAESGKTNSEDVDGKKDGEKEIEKEKIENNQLSEEKVDEVVAESTGDEEKVGSVNEATKAESADEKATEGDKTENGDNKVAEGEETENEDKKDDGNENTEKAAEAASLSSFQQLSSSQNAFTGLAGTGFSNSTFAFGSILKDGPQLGFSSGSLSGLKSDQPSFGFGLSSNGSSSLFGTSGTSIGTKSEGSGFVSMQEVPVETGEENEKAAFTADSVLFEFFDGGWKERGKGELKVNVATTGEGKARLVMRARGNYRLILNASLYADMKLTNMEKRGITFACVNSIGEGKDGLSTFALKFKDASIVEEFRSVVTEHKAKTAEVLKTPENSPKASDD
ncbi:nuclear pore complex protein NUP50A-like [Cornus florida]|uniref:nuclear pore complex protein NUP50A-like n=1 Tax=Cornus florida TaxID=4283 RepID=UPI00289C12DF|nr:nuclear pore complex protein NUP50A-like [Cornus florida]XP_059640679.1 nuclear pore complex protein NUP50A-like [Cornus florida]